jgi:hypothetical protein
LEVENSHLRRILPKDSPAPFYLLGFEENKSFPVVLGLFSSLGRFREDASAETASLQSCDLLLWDFFCIEEI